MGKPTLIRRNRQSPSLLAVLILSTCLAAAQAAPTIAAFGTPAPDPSKFFAWRTEFRQRALELGLAASAVDAILAGTEFRADVVQQDRHQPEAHQSLAEYEAEVEQPNVIADGQAAYARDKQVFAAALAHYGVDAWPILGIWANESRYGKLVRRYPIASSVATLAFDLRRRAYFENELISLIRMQQAGVPGLPAMTGSWAGALGQPQFEPSDYLDYAVDFDGDSRKDIWTSEADVIGSIANFLHRHGWHSSVPWGGEVTAAPDLVAANNLARSEPSACPFSNRLSQRLSVKEWRALGVQGGELDDALEASLLSFKLAGTKQFLVTRNFEVILTYNCSLHYALTAARVSDLVLGKP